MKQYLYLILLACFLSHVSLHAQVGIGNTNPQAILDIAASNTATPSNTDGVLVPRIDDFPSTVPTSAQDGMLIFVTGNGTPTKGFYYWDEGTTAWVEIAGVATTASNGLTATGNNVRLGGTLTQSTNVIQGIRDLNFNLNGTGEFHIQDNSSTFFEATDIGTVDIGRNFSYNTREILNVFGRLSHPAYYVANFENTYNGARGNGISIRLAATAPNGNYYYAGFFRSGGNLLSGRIAGTGTGVIYVTASDRRLKNSIIDIPNSLELIDKIQPRLYEYNDIPGIKEYGFIAQELQPIYPQAVSGNASDDVITNPMMVDYGRLTPILTAGVKELNTKLETQQTEIEALKLEIEALKMFLNNFDTHLVTTKLNKN